MKITKALIIISIITISCEKKEAVPMWNPNTNDLDTWKTSALEKGDTSAYWNLSINYMDSPDDGFLYTALIMANKYKYQQAYIDAYDCITDRHHKKEQTELEDLDEQTKLLALDILKRGAERNKECRVILGKYYLKGKYVEKNVLKGNQLINEGEK